MTTVDACLKEALERISNFVADTTGQPATPEELADALTRYFVLQEIKGHIEMAREKIQWADRTIRPTH
jgi:hypothetical protein